MRTSGIVPLQDAAEAVPVFVSPGFRFGSALASASGGVGRSRGESSPIMATASLPGTKDCKMEGSDAHSPGLLRRSGARRDEYAWRAF